LGSVAAKEVTNTTGFLYISRDISPFEEIPLATTIFYSWQSDSHPKTNHRFIKECLEDAVKQLVEGSHVDVAPRVDHDMKDVHGDQDVVPTILRKIDDCDVFVADVTIVAATDEGKNLPNPNVLLELGYAYKAAGPNRIIKIMNTAYGHPELGLPFDLAHKRWPYTYTLEETANKERRQKVKQELSRDLAEMILLIRENEGEKRPGLPTPSQFDQLHQFLTESREGLTSLVRERRETLPDCGWYSLSFCFDPPPSNSLPTRPFLDQILDSNPCLTGWPLWLDTRGFDAPELRPFVHGDCWEVFLDTSSEPLKHIDYWRASARGFFSHVKALEDDIPWKERGPIPLETFEYAVMLRRIAEAIVCSLAFAEKLGVSDGTVFFHFSVDRLRGRRLSSWGTPGAMTMNRSTCRQEEYSAQLQYKANTPVTAIAGIVDDLSKSLICQFGGFVAGPHFIHELVKSLLNKQW
jgi:hypothetical protein